VHTVAETVLLCDTEMRLEARSRLGGVIARRLQAMGVRDVSVMECGRQTKGWLVEEQRLAPADAARRMWLARRLPAHPGVADALSAGEINHDHAHVILGCVMKLPDDWCDAAEAELLAFAREHDPAALAALCRELRIRLVADEDAEAAAQRKYDNRWVTRRADALVDLARLALDFAGLPDHGGERPNVIVTIPFAELRDELAAGQVGNATLNGQPITPNTARMLACDANIIPAVLGGHSEVLDLGRSQRNWSTAQRRARRIEDNGCGWPGCQATLERCRIHHLTYWAQLGKTNLNNGLHLCQFHHWLVHHTNWKIWRDHDGRIQIRRTYTKKRRRPSEDSLAAFVDGVVTSSAPLLPSWHSAARSAPLGHRCRGSSACRCRRGGRPSTRRRG
jgi:hypothetical protein